VCVYVSLRVCVCFFVCVCCVSVCVFVFVNQNFVTPYSKDWGLGCEWFRCTV